MLPSGEKTRPTWAAFVCWITWLSVVGLVGASHVVQEDVLRRVGRVERTRPVIERVLASADDRQRRAVRAELRLHRLACDEVWVGGQRCVQGLLNRAGYDRRRDVLPGCQLRPRYRLTIIVIFAAPQDGTTVVGSDL